VGIAASADTFDATIEETTRPVPDARAFTVADCDRLRGALDASAVP